MKITSTNTGNNLNPSALGYPWIGVASDQPDRIVCFTSEKEGFTLSDPSRGVGYHSITWIEELFVPFLGKITITTER